MTTMTSNGNGSPARLGDVKLQRTRSGWDCYQAGALVASGLATKTALAIIRGELAPAELRNGTRPTGQSGV